MHGMNNIKSLKLD